MTRMTSIGEVTRRGARLAREVGRFRDTRCLRGWPPTYAGVGRTEEAVFGDVILRRMAGGAVGGECTKTKERCLVSARFITRMKDCGAISMWLLEALMTSSGRTGMTSRTSNRDSDAVTERLHRR